MGKDWHYLFLGRAIQVVFSIAAIKLLTNHLSAGEVGNYYLINTLIGWMGLVMINPVGTYYNRHLHPWRQKNLLRASFVALNKFFFFVAALCVPVVFILRSLLGVANGIPLAGLTALLFFFTYLSSWYQTLCPTLNLFGDRKMFVLFTTLAQGAGLLLAIAYIHVSSRSALVWLAGIVTGQALAALLSWKYFSDNIFGPEPRSQKSAYFFNRDLLSFSLPVMASTFFLWAQTQGYRLIIETTVGTEVLAFLGVGLGLATAASVAIEAIGTQLIFPDFFRDISNADSAGRRSAWEKMWVKAVCIYLPAMAYVESVSDLALRALTAPQYHTVVALVRWGCAIDLFRMLSGITFLISHSEKKTRKSILPNLVGAAFVFMGVGLVAKLNPGSLIIYAPIILTAGAVLTFFATWLSMRSLIFFSLSPKVILRCLCLSTPMVAFSFFPLNSWPSLKIGVAVVLAAYTLFLTKQGVEQSSGGPVKAVPK